MARDLVIGIDSATTATKAIAWDRTGAPVAEGRAAIPLAQLTRAISNKIPKTDGARHLWRCASSRQRSSLRASRAWRSRTSARPSASLASTVSRSVRLSSGSTSGGWTRCARPFGGEGGIRTLGTGYPVRQISNLVPSTTRPPLRVTKPKIYALFAVGATSQVRLEAMSIRPCPRVISTW
jgi:hypothetical protein